MVYGSMVTGQDSSVCAVQSFSGAMLDRNASKTAGILKSTRLSRLSRARNRQSVETTQLSLPPVLIDPIKKRRCAPFVPKGGKWIANVRKLGAALSIKTSILSKLRSPRAASAFQSHSRPYLYGCLWIGSMLICLIIWRDRVKVDGRYFTLTICP